MDSPQRSWRRKAAGIVGASAMFVVAGKALLPVSAPAAVPVTEATNAAVNVRPKVGVRVMIEAPLYRQKLDGDQSKCGAQCEALQRSLTDTARVLLADRYGFAEWSSAGPGTRDTVTVRLFQSGVDARMVKMEVSMGGRAHEFGSAPEEVEFEKKTLAALRPNADWQAQRLRSAWADSLSRRLDAYSERLVSNVVGRLPLRGDVVIDPTRPSADVRLLADSLRAADSPTPKFLVRLAMPVATTSGDIVTDTGEMVLEGCRRTGRGFYACEVRGFRWRDLTGTDTLFRQKARNARVTTASVHLRAYTPAPRTIGAGGLVAPVGGNP